MDKILVSLLYVMLLGLTLLVFDYFFGLFMHHLMFKMLTWFNNQWLFLKLSILLVFAGICTFIFDALGIAAFFIGIGISYICPKNRFTVSASYILVIANVCLTLFILWRAMPAIQFWLVVELLVISVYVWLFNAVFLLSSGAEFKRRKAVALHV
jgi:hypothetical protein